MLINVPFKPKARLLLQLGEQLIKNESIAMLELIKNAYDADATVVNVEMIDVDCDEEGYILIQDNGKGMDLDIIQNIWMEPGNNHKNELVSKNKRSELGRLPIGEKGIGRFGVHKLGHKINLISKMRDKKEVYISIDWDEFEKADYLEDVKIKIQEREPQIFKDGATGTQILIKNLSAEWTRGMVRNVYRAINSLNSPFASNVSFDVDFYCNREAWLDGLLEFDKIKEYALYTSEITIENNYITQLKYEFNPNEVMLGLKTRHFELENKIRMVDEESEDIDLDEFNIGKIRIILYIYDRSPVVLSKLLSDKKAFREYLDFNGGISVFRDGIRIYDYGEPENDWLGFDSKRVNRPSEYLSNNITLGAILLDRKYSTDLREKTNREGFIENEAYVEFKKAVLCAIDHFLVHRNIDRINLRDYLRGGQKEPITEDVSEIRKKIQEYIPNDKQRKEIDSYLKRIESDYDYIKKMYLKTATAGMSYGVIIHEIEKIIAELNHTVTIERSSQKVTLLAKHLARLIDNYAELLRNKAKTNNSISSIIDQALFSIEYRLQVHEVSVEVEKNDLFYKTIKCSSNLIVGSIINIIDNSIWWTIYSKIPKRKIYIKVTKEIPGLLSIVIADNGEGFTLPTEDIIKPFVGARPSGMGLGLNIANEIMISQGGKLVFPSSGDIDLPREFSHGAIVALGFKEV